ncbi:MAG: hypothetical protein IJS47_04015, partial [Clostridia bacterium]|nr:hypothetical protein [Clostridia bacterium]
MQDFLLKSFDLSIAANNKRAYKNDGIGNLTVEEFETAFMYFDSKCAYSGRAFESKEQISIEHIIPITSGGHSMAFNCIPVIKKFNTLKSGYHLLDWWRSYKVTNTETLYTPYRHLKIVNYMLKALESINMEDKREYILTPDFVDEFLKAHENELNAPKAEKHDGKAYERLSQIEIMRALDLITVEDAYVLYNDLDGLKLNPAIFFEESLHVLEGAIPKEIIERINDRIKKVPDIYIDDKKVYRGVMDKEDVEIRNKLFKWAEDEHIENEFSVIGYLDFELLKSQDNLIEFLNRRKKEILEIIGAKEEDFGTIVNKIPNILTNLNLANRVKAIEENL